MNRHIPIVVNALSLVAATGITALIISVHAADRATLGAHDVAASAGRTIARIDTTGVQPPPRIALARSSVR